MVVDGKSAGDRPLSDQVFQNTEIATASLVPEVRLRLLTDDSPLWQAFGEEPGADKLPRAYWAFAWSGGQALARYVLDHAEVVRDRSVLDFGAGGGIASVAAAKCGARSVAASEIDPVALAAVEVNAELNEVQVEGICDDLIYAENRGWDVVLAGDLWYNSRLARHGVAWLRRFARDGVLVLTGDPGRHFSLSAGLEELASYQVRSIPDLEHPQVQTVRVCRLLPTG